MFISDDASSDTSPSTVLHRLGMGHWISQSLYVVTEMGVADQLRGEARSIDDLAQSVGAHTEALYRVLRALASIGIFTEIKSRHFALTPVGQLLRTDIPDSMHDLATTISRDWEPWGHMMQCVRTGQSAYHHQYGMSFFSYLQENPNKAELFNKAMGNFVTNHGIVAVSFYDFTPYTKVIDIGGGHGLLMKAILESNPDLNGIIFDLPHVIAVSEKSIIDHGLSGRCKCIQGDFFTSVPSGGDVYVLASIIHDWDDEQGILILKNCRKVIPDQGKLLMLEMVVPPGDTPSIAKLLDLQMLVSLGGKERTEEQYRSLLSDAGFRLNRIIPTSALPSILEANPN
jgi:hypothetical protein